MGCGCISIYLISCRREISGTYGGCSNPQFITSGEKEPEPAAPSFLLTLLFQGQPAEQEAGCKSTGFGVRQPGSSSRWGYLLCYVTSGLRLITTDGLRPQKSIK